MAYTIINPENIINEVSHSTVYKTSSFIRAKIEAFICDLSLHINSKKISDYPLLFKFIYEIPVKNGNHDTYVLGVQYTIENNCIKIIKTKFFKK